MKYKVLAIPPFDKQLKRLSKKYPSLKKEYTELIQNLESNPHQGKHIGITATKSGFQSLQKLRESQEAQGLFLILLSRS